MAHRIVAPVRWGIVGSTVRGLAHDAVQLPNQDAIGWETGDGPRGVSVLAVSDGHGNAKCFRSDRGSKFAVAVAIEIFSAFGRQANDDVPSFQAEVQDRFAREISETWNRRVDADIREHPFTKQDEAQVEAAEEHGFAEVAEDPLLAYGATLIVVLLAPAFALYAQIGDGDILVVDNDGSTRRVFTPTTALPLNVTNSLCQHDAWRNVRFELVPFDEVIPELIVATTDGYVNSFSTADGFLQVGRDLRAMIQSDGLSAIGQRLETFLGEASAAGSRDDVTLGIVKRLDEKQPTYRRTAYDESMERARSRPPIEAPTGEPYRRVVPDSKATRYRDDPPADTYLPARRSTNNYRSQPTRTDRLALSGNGKWMVILVATLALAVLTIFVIWTLGGNRIFNASPTQDVTGELAQGDALLFPREHDGDRGGDANTVPTQSVKLALSHYTKAAKNNPTALTALRRERYAEELLHAWNDAVRFGTAAIIIDSKKPAAAASELKSDLQELVYAEKNDDAGSYEYFLKLAKTLYPDFTPEGAPTAPIASAPSPAKAPPGAESAAASKSALGAHSPVAAQSPSDSASALSAASAPAAASPLAAASAPVAATPLAAESPPVGSSPAAVPPSNAQVSPNQPTPVTPP